MHIAWTTALQSHRAVTTILAIILGGAPCSLDPFCLPICITRAHTGFAPPYIRSGSTPVWKSLSLFERLRELASQKNWTHASVSNINVSHDNEAWQKAIVSACGYLSVWTMAKQWLWGITGVRRTEAVADSLRRDSACEVERRTDRRTRHSTTATETSRIQTDNWSMCEQK